MSKRLNVIKGVVFSVVLTASMFPVQALAEIADEIKLVDEPSSIENLMNQDSVEVGSEEYSSIIDSQSLIDGMALSEPTIVWNDGEAQEEMSISPSYTNDGVYDYPTIITQPSDYVGPIGTKATFTVVATGEGLAYQWQWSRDNGKTWTNSSSTFVGYQSASMQVPITAVRDGYRYRCVVTDANGAQVTSEAAKLSVAAALSIVKQPENYVGALGTKATFTVEATGTGLTYQWQWSRDNGKTWANSSSACPGFDTASMQVPITSVRNGYQYRCVVGDATGQKVTSDAAKLTIGTALSITEQPSDYTGPLGTKATFTVEATGTDLSYQWQWSRDNGKTWTNSSSTFAGYQSSSMQVPITAARDGYQYRCVVSDAAGQKVTSDPAKLTIGSVLAITTQPSDYAGSLGDKATFTLEATGTGLTYQWQWSRDNGKTWTNSSSAFPGYRSASMEVSITSARDGYLYRCVIADALGNKVTSKAVMLSIVTPLSLSKQPEDYVGMIGTKATFTIEVAGDALAYRWQWSRDNGTTWTNSSSTFVGYNTASMQVPITAARDGYLYRCVVTNSLGQKVTSDAAKLTVQSLEPLVALITISPAKLGEVATFICDVTGAASSDLSYRWQAQDVSTGVWCDCDFDGADSKVATCVLASQEDLEVAFRCWVTSADGRTAISNTESMSIISSGELNASVATSPVSLGDTAVLVCAVDGYDQQNAQMGLPEGIESIEWQSSADNGNTWSVCTNEGSDGPAMNVIATEKGADILYRAVVVASDGRTAVSEPVKLDIDGLLASVTTNTVAYGGTANLVCTVANAEGKTLAYCWQCSIDGIDWSNIEGANASTLSLTASVEAATYQYRCVVMDETEAAAFSEAIGLSIESSLPNLRVKAHVKDLAWLDYVGAGETAGTTGRSLNLEAIKVKLVDGSGNSAISYRVHSKNVGWGSWKNSDETAGTIGQSLQAEAFQAKLTGEYASAYDLYYRVHVADVGWLGWAKNGETAGSVGLKRAIESIQVVLVRKGEPFDVGRAHELVKPTLTYRAHVENKDWMGAVSENGVAGTTNQSLRMEAIKISMSDVLGNGNAISYRAHVSDVGWMDWVTSGHTAGTTGQSRQMECIQIQLSGYAAKIFDVYYRVHVEDYGWLGWAKNGEMAGTTGGSKRIEAIQIKLVNRGVAVDVGGDAYKALSGSNTPITTGAAVTLNVPNYKQTDSRWSGVYIGSKTIGQVGCLVTSLAMKYSYHTGTATYPNAMRNMCSFDDNSFIWASATALGYTYTGQYNSGITNSMMSLIYSQLKAGNPVIIGGSQGSKQHWVIITGYTGTSTTSFNASDFLINDPNSTTRTTLAAFLNIRPNVLRLIY